MQMTAPVVLLRLCSNIRFIDFEQWLPLKYQSNENEYTVPNADNSNSTNHSIRNEFQANIVLSYPCLAYLQVKKNEILKLKAHN